MLDSSLIFKSDVGTSLVGNSNHLNLGPFKFWTKFESHIPLAGLGSLIVTESRPLCLNSLV